MTEESGNSPTETEPKRAADFADRAYERLRADIVMGRLEAGQPISQLTVARQLGISRGPIREALRQLQQEELVVARKNHRFSVAPFEIGDLESVFALTLANCSLAIRVGARLLSPAEIQEAADQVDRMDAAAAVTDIDSWEAAYREFAKVITGGAGSRPQILVLQFVDHIRRYRRNLLKKFPHVWLTGDRALHDVVEAVGKGDGARAAALYADYLGRMALLIMAGAAPRHDPVRFRAYLDAILAQQD